MARLPALPALGFLLLLCAAPPCPAQADPSAAASLEIDQRYDLRRRVNGAYAGLFYGDAKSYWRLGPAAADGAVPVEATTYLMEESLKDLEKSTKTLKAQMRSAFSLDPSWAVSGHSGDPAPFAGGFPRLPDPGLASGSVWEAPAVLVVDPRGSGSWTRIKIAVSYELVGNARYRGRPAIELRARFALRYRRGQDPDGDPGLDSAEGTREAWIYLDAATRWPLFIRERLSGEAYRYADGGSVANDGFILSFFSPGGAIAASRLSDKAEIGKRLEKTEKVRVTEGERGLSISLDDLMFVADSPELLPGEEGRLAAIASALGSLPAERSFLVVGHTAAVGSAESQTALSLERAKRVAAALAARGIDPGRFAVDGKGGTEPAGDDATEEGRARNRRVEIILLD